VTAIESRDPTTSGHSARVANLTVGLATAIDRCTTGPHRLTRFSAEEITELRYAALLHDFGKVGVREQVLVKAKKFLPGELDRIRQRVELIKRGLALRYAGKKIEHLVEKGRRRYAAEAAALDAELAAYVTQLDQGLARIVAANEPALLPREFAASIERLAFDVFEDHLGNREAVITPEEAAILAIPRGSLTPAEFKEIQSHVIHTYEFLTRIPWTREFRGIPAIARSHHEKLDGTGYPEGRSGREIPVQSRMMTIADIYDALTAGDRPYKKGITTPEALDILEHERRAGHLDGALLDVFVEAKIYEQALTPSVSPSAGDRHHPMR
jgi:response regulator RpfG family c-di-GMP phosphodiesterase